MLEIFLFFSLLKRFCHFICFFIDFCFYILFFILFWWIFDDLVFFSLVCLISIICYELVWNNFSFLLNLFDSKTFDWHPKQTSFALFPHHLKMHPKSHASLISQWSPHNNQSEHPDSLSSQTSNWNHTTETTHLLDNNVTNDKINCILTCYHYQLSYRRWSIATIVHLMFRCFYFSCWK